MKIRLQKVTPNITLQKREVTTISFVEYKTNIPANIPKVIKLQSLHIIIREKHRYRLKQ